MNVYTRPDRDQALAIRPRRRALGGRRLKRVLSRHRRVTGGGQQAHRHSGNRHEFLSGSRHTRLPSPPRDHAVTTTNGLRNSVSPASALGKAFRACRATLSIQLSIVVPLGDSSMLDAAPVSPNAALQQVGFAPARFLRKRSEFDCRVVGYSCAPPSSGEVSSHAFRTAVRRRGGLLDVGTGRLTMRACHAGHRRL